MQHNLKKDVGILGRIDVFTCSFFVMWVVQYVQAFSTVNLKAVTCHNL